MSKIFAQILIKDSIKKRTINKIKHHINNTNIRHNNTSNIKQYSWTVPKKNRKEKSSWI